MDAIIREKMKSEKEKAKDIAYTINHALVCATTDIIDPFVAAWSQKNLGKKLHTSWCNFTHDHSHDLSDNHAHSHHDHNNRHKHIHKCDAHHPCDEKATFGGSLKHWIIGEAIGDIGAVPVTIAFQRFTPKFMDWLNDSMEKVLGNQYKNSARIAAKKWAKNSGINNNSLKIKEYENEIYNYEVKHFGQAAVWTVASVGLNIASQKFITGNKHPVSYLLLYKSLGAATSASILLGGRAYMPEKFHSWDKWTADNMFSPATKTIGKLFGVKEKEVENILKKEKSLTDSSWQEKIDTDKSQQLQKKDKSVTI
ncbi:MAG: hypothetical protein R3D71_06085 [Rickettsiales bacterium]